MALAEDCGISQFEISHLFTQWGAGHAPKIMGLRDGREERLFGWETDAASPAYEAFLRAFLRALRAHLDETGRLARCYFHLSDEPSLSALDSYARAAALLREELEGCSIIDALSDYAFYEKGLLQRPVPSIDHLAPFLDHGVLSLIHISVGLVFARSGLAVKHGIGLSNGVGVIDSDYTGEIRVGLINQSAVPYDLHPGERIAQLVVMPICRPELVEADTLEETERGAGGFGSTGRL